MSITDVFTKMSARVIEGTMFHESLAKVYLFLNLSGYAACHEYHYLSESASYMKLCRYIANHLNTIVSPIPRTDDAIIPKSWNMVSRSDISPQIRKEAIVSSFHEWLKWEQGTKALYEKLYKDAYELGDIAGCKFIETYILDVDSEIVYVRNELISKQAMDFDIVSIFEEQRELKKFFTKKIRKVGDGIDEDE